jgi:hypothetical protein
MPFQLCYASTATRELSRNDLLEILTYARKRNAEDAITGLLLFHGGHFLQVLEGDAEKVRACFKRICDDNRHTQITLLFEELVSPAQYPDWSIGFQSLDGSEWMEFPVEDESKRDLRALTKTAH